MKLEQVAMQLKILGNPIRLKVFRQLVRLGQDGAPVGVIQAKLDIPLSTLSNHIQKLVVAGLAKQERKGVELICTANFEAMQEMVDYLNKECCIDAC